MVSKNVCWIGKMKKAEKTSKAEETPPRPDGRKALLLYLKPEVTLALKKAALDASMPGCSTHDPARQSSAR